MSQDPVAQAASNNPLLKTLVAAVSGKLNPNVNLVSTLNGAEFTVFAPVDSAFAKLDAATVNSLKDPANAALLTSILTYHVVAGQIAPDAIDGTQTTVSGATVPVTGSGDNIKVKDATVICGGVHTANARCTSSTRCSCPQPRSSRRLHPSTPSDRPAMLSWLADLAFPRLDKS
jgi:uncharacterized surface protein with fasciclin (FAS1) repeats